MKATILFSCKSQLFPIAAIMFLSCSLSNGSEQILGTFEAANKEKTKTMLYNISHIKENSYGVKFIAGRDGKETETAYYEGTYNENEKILSINTGLSTMNLQFSDDFDEISMIGDKSGYVMYRK